MKMKLRTSLWWYVLLTCPRFRAELTTTQSYVAAEFKNWGLTVLNTPAYTFVPTTVYGLQNLVRWAKANNKRIRAAGYRHSWTPLFSEDDEILVSMLDVKVAEAVPDPMSILPDDPSILSNEFKVIELADSAVAGSGGNKRLVRIGGAVTNEELRRWSIRGNAWTLPFNTIVSISAMSAQTGANDNRSLKLLLVVRMRRSAM
jgi:hypothetical protein